MKNACFPFLFLFALLTCTISYSQVIIPVETTGYAIVLRTDKDNRLSMVYCGNKLNEAADYKEIAGTYHYSDDNSGIYSNAYTPSGTWSLSEPAIQVTHADGNQSLELKYISHQTTKPDNNTSLTTVHLEDPVYKLAVDLFYKTWNRENVIEQWSTITNNEKGPVILQKYASANLYFPSKDAYLTSFQGEYLKEMQPNEEKLLQGIRTIDSKLGTRAMLL